MGILLGLVAAIGAVGVLLWRVNMAAGAARELGEAAKDARGLARGWSWRRKFAKDPLDLAQDPREAAVAMMAAMAQSDGAMTERERRAILAEIVQKFETPAKQAEELLAHGRWLARDVRDIDYCFKKLVPVLRRACKPDQMRDVLEMVTRAASADGEPGAAERESIALLKRSLSA